MHLQKLLTFFSAKILIFAIFNVQRFNNTLANNIISFEQLAPGVQNFEYQLTRKKKDHKIVMLSYALTSCYLSDPSSRDTGCDKSIGSCTTSWVGWMR